LVLAGNFVEGVHLSAARACFTRADHLSTMTDIKFVVVDAALEGTEPAALNVTSFPVLVLLVDGVVNRAQYHGFDEEFVLSFINSHVVSGARSISTPAELDQFYSETQLGLLVAVDAALPYLANYYHDHYHEVTLAYASPSLFDSPGFYLYR
jgi:hypothetical protein